MASAVPAGCAVATFFYYNAMGIRANGIGKYLAHFAGPMWQLAPLMIPIELISHLAEKGLRIRLVSRNPKSADGADQVVSADLANLDQTVSAVAGSEVVYLLAGLKYDLRVWRDLWPSIMNNVIEACKRANAKLIFFDNVYAYGKVVGPMTEQPFAKGRVFPNHSTVLQLGVVLV